MTRGREYKETVEISHLERGDLGYIKVTQES